MRRKPHMPTPDFEQWALRLNRELGEAQDTISQLQAEIARYREANRELHRRAQKAEAYSQACNDTIALWARVVSGSIRPGRPDKICMESWRRGEITGVELVHRDLIKRQQKYAARASLGGSNDH